MCLNIKENKRIKFTFKEIECYKVVEVCNNRYYTPYMSAYVEIGKTYKSKLKKNRNYVDDGLHSFSDFEEAKAFISYWGSDFILVKCVIPKYSFYYVGSFDGIGAYASSKLKYVEKVNMPCV